MRRDLRFFNLISTKVLSIIIIMILPLNLIALTMVNSFIENAVDQARLTEQNLADIYMATLKMSMDNASSLLYYFVSEDSNCIVWMNGLYYLSNRGGSQLFTIQIVLNNINEDVKALIQSSTGSSSIVTTFSQMPSTTIRMAIAVIGILPILILYPFFQRDFVKGITLGGVKE